MEIIIILALAAIVVGLVSYIVASRVARTKRQKLTPLIGVVLPKEEGK